MSAIDTLFENVSIGKFSTTGLITSAWTELAELSASAAEADALRATVAEQAKVIALNKYVTPPFDLCDDDTVELALECVKKDETIAKQAQTIETAREAIDYACETWPARDSDYYRPDHETAMDDLRAWLAANAPTPTPAQGETESKA